MTSHTVKSQTAKLTPLLALTVLGSALMSCGQQANTPNLGGLPPLDTGITVRFDAAPDNTYLTLSTDEDAASKVVYQKAVPTGARDFKPDLNDWKALSKDAVALTLPGGQTTPAVLFLKWGMFQDKNSNGKPDAGEWLNRMTHDRVTYADKAFQAEFDGPEGMHQSWSIQSGWSRAEHYVYAPLEGNGKYDFRRFSRSTPAWDFTLHVETPLSSM